MMKMLRILLCALLLVIGGATAAVAAQGQPQLMVPIKGTLVGQDEEPTPGVFPGCLLEAGQAPLLWRFTSEGTGQVSHLGRVTYQFTHCTHVDFTLTEGVMTLTAANGDTLVLTYTGEITQYVPGGADAFWKMSWTPSSGTGRFADASGSGGDGFAVTHTDTSPLAGTTDLTFQGMITYNASNRAAK
jgi:hypothetical protein